MDWVSHLAGIFTGIFIGWIYFHPAADRMFKAMAKALAEKEPRDDD